MTTVPVFNIKRMLIISRLVVRLSRPRELLLVMLVSTVAGIAIQSLVLSIRTILGIVLPARLLVVVTVARSRMALLTSSVSAWLVFGTVRRGLDPVLLLLYGLLVVLELLEVLAPRCLLVLLLRRLLMLLLLVASSRPSLVPLLGLS
jgi:hypothetical protein